MMTMELSSLFAGRRKALWWLCGEMVYVYYVVLRFNKGLPRLLALLPVFPPSFLLPWWGQSATERTLYCFLFLWTIMSKLLLLVWDKGPAADSNVVTSFPRFFSAMTFALHLKRGARFIKKIPSPPPEEKDDDGEGRMRSNTEHSKTRNGLGLRKAVAATKSGEINVNNSISNTVQVDGKLGHSWTEKVMNSQAGGIVLLRSIVYFIVTASLVRTVLEWGHVIPIYILNLFLGFIIYFSCLFLFESTAGASACLLGTQVQAQFNMPFLADSIADFWGRRWNLIVNNLLRVSVHEPMLEYLTRENDGDAEGEGKKERRKATPRDRAIAVFSTFLVSGLMHELIFFYLNQTRPTGEMTAFFVLNGAATVVEGLVKPRDRLRMPRVLCRAYSLSFVYLTACWLFFPPVFRTGMVKQCIVDLETFVDWIWGITGGFLLNWAK